MLGTAHDQKLDPPRIGRIPATYRRRSQVMTSEALGGGQTALNIPGSSVQLCYAYTHRRQLVAAFHCNRRMQRVHCTHILRKMKENRKFKGILPPIQVLTEQNSKRVKRDMVKNRKKERPRITKTLPGSLELQRFFKQNGFQNASAVMGPCTSRHGILNFNGRHFALPTSSIFLQNDWLGGKIK